MNSVTGPREESIKSTETQNKVVGHNLQNAVSIPQLQNGHLVSMNPATQHSQHSQQNGASTSLPLVSVTTTSNEMTTSTSPMKHVMTTSGTTPQASSSPPTTAQGVTKTLVSSSSSPLTTAETSTSSTTTQVMPSPSSTTTQAAVSPSTTTQATVSLSATTQAAVSASTTTQAIASPSTTTQATASPSTTTQATVSPSTTTQATASPSTTTQATVSPSATTQDSVSPSATTQATVSPSTTTQATASPSTTAQATVSPSTTTQATSSPSTTMQAIVSPPATTQDSVSPSATTQATVSPSTTTQATASPSTTAQATVSPSTTTQATSSPSTTMQAIVSPSATTQADVSSSATTQATVSPSTTTQASVSPSTATQASVSPSATTQASVSPSTTTQAAVSPSATTQATVSLSTTTQAAISSSATIGTTASPSTTAQATVSPSTTTQATSSPSTTMQAIVSPSATTQATVSSSATTQATVSPSTTTQASVSPSTATQASVSPSATTQASVSPSTTTQAAVSPSATVQATVSLSTTTQTARSSSATIGTTASPSATTKASVSPSTITQASVSSSTTTQATVSPSTTTQASLSPSTTTQAAVSPSTTTQAIVSPSATTQASVSPSTPIQAIVSPSATTQDSTMSTATSLLPKTEYSPLPQSTAPMKTTTSQASSLPTTTQASALPTTTQASTVPPTTQISALQGKEEGANKLGSENNAKEEIIVSNKKTESSKDETGHKTDTKDKEKKDENAETSMKVDNLEIDLNSKMNKKAKKAEEPGSNELEKEATDGKPSVHITSEESELDESVKKIYIGQCSMKDLPPQNKKVVRIFVSSTFSDTKEERNALMQNVYPKLAELCREKYGLEFQVVDMRWGVPEQAADNHSTTDLCLQEIRKCQQVSVGPCFVAIVGNKYGFRPVPTYIPEKLYETMEGCSNSSEWELLRKWYRKDENAQPVLYVLQAVSVMIPEVTSSNRDKQKEGWNAWNNQNNQLTSTLRSTAQLAYESKKIEYEDMQKFFISVTENEIKEGVDDSPHGKLEDTSLFILRKIPDIEHHLNEEKAPKFIDLQKSSRKDDEAQKLLMDLKEKKIPTKIPKSNLVQMDIEWSASGASVSLESVSDTEVAKYAEKLATHPLNINKHLDYIDSVCKEFFQNISKLIQRGNVKQSNLYTPMTSEVLQHFHLGKGRCEVFEGRDEIMSQVKSYLEGTGDVPMTIYGKSGCGKTSVMSRVLECLCSSEWISSEGKPYVTVVRFLGTTPLTSNLYLLIVSICRQLSSILEETWEEPTKFSELTKNMHSLLGRVAESHKVILLLDSIDQLMPAYNAYKMNWMPEVLPTNTKVVVSTIEEGYPVLDAMKEMFQDRGAEYIEVKQLGEALGMKVISKWLDAENRKMNDQQSEVVQKALNQCSLPLYARIAFDHIRKWRSFDMPSIDQLETTVKGAINQLFKALEAKFGEPLIKHALSYLTASRHGLSEVELEHLMSLDDVLLSKVYKFWRPPIRRIPPLLWTRIRSDISSYIVERSADDILVLFWYHRQFIEATKERYLKDSDFALMIHSNMTDFFLGKWGGGTAKPFEYSEHQKQRFGLDDIHSEADRKVPNQPYIIRTQVGGNIKLRFNKRKLFELPFHLLKCKMYEILKTEVFFNFEWLYATLQGSSAMSILDEFEVFMKADKTLRHDSDMKVLFANLRLIRPYISKFPNSLSYELSGRLTKLIRTSPDIMRLIQQCDNVGSAYCPMVPVLSCFATADSGLQQNINYRASESWHEGGAFAITNNFRTMYILDYDDIGICKLSSWDVESGELIVEQPIVRDEDQGKQVIYIQIYLDQSEDHLIAFNRGKHYFTSEEKRDYGQGHVDIIRVSDGKVLRTMTHSLHRDILANPLMYMTKNWIACKMGTTFPMFRIDDGTHINLNRCHALSSDEEYLVINQCHKTVLRKFDNKQAVWEFDPPGSILAIAITTDFSSVVMAGPGRGELRTYDLRKKQLKTEKLYGYIIKTKFLLSIPKKASDDLAKAMKVNECEQLEVFVKLTLSSDDEYALAMYQSRNVWVPMLYNIYKGKRISSFVGQIGNPVSKETRYPEFASDNQYIIVAKNCNNGKKVVQIFTVTNAQKVFEYFLDQTIKDFAVSSVSDQIAVMTAKDVTFLSVASTQGEESMEKKKKPKRQTDAVTAQQLLPREVLSEKNILNEISISETQTGESVIEEVLVAGQTLDTDPLASARSKKQHALDIRCTPNGLRVVQLHSRVQVVDTVMDEIRYSPKSGETITRSVVSPVDGKIVNETVQIPSGAIRNQAIDMQDSDRIVTENNKVKFRVSSATRGHVKIMPVPSVMTVYTAFEGKMKKLQRFTVYQESIVALSNRYLVTYRQKSNGDYFNVYEIEEGKLLATHEAIGGFSSAIITNDESHLIVIGSYLAVRVYEAPQFLSCEIKIDTREISAVECTWTVQNILCAPKSELDASPPAIVMFYKPTKAQDGIFRKFCYQFVDIPNREVGKYMVLNTALEDVSRDGSLGIDTQLAVYSMKEGRVVRQVPYSQQSSKMHLHVRFTEDLRFVIFVDRADDTVHVVSMTQHSFKHIASCFTHTPKMDFFHGLSLRLGGKVIMLACKESETIILRLLDSTEVGKITKNIRYSSEQERALSFVQ